MLWKYILITGVIAVAMAEVNDNDADLLRNAIALPPELNEKFNGSDIQNMKEKFKEALIKKCEVNGHSETSENLETMISMFVKCVTSLVDWKVLQSEVEAAKPTGSVDEVFKKYCEKTPQFTQCFRNLTDSAKPCFNHKEQMNVAVVHNITNRLAEFICSKGGERIALFIAEGGKECVESKRDEVQNCFNDTFGAQSQHYLNDTAFSFINSPILEFGKEQCEQIDSFKNCVVDVYDKCDPPTTSNVVDSLFKYAREATPCKNITRTSKPRNSSGFATTSATLVIALAALLVV